MVIVKATMHPHGDASRAYELLHVTIENRTDPGEDTREQYFAHVAARPSARLGILGYEADVEVREHRSQDGFAPLLMAVLGAAHDEREQVGVFLPPARALARLTLHEAITFERAIKDRR